MSDNNKDIAYYNNLEIKPYIGAIVLVLTLMLLGVFGNVHVLFVYTFRMKATSHRIFIIALAVLDLLSCLVSMPFITADMFLRLTFNSSIACRIFRFFLYFFAGSSGFLLLPIAVDRYLKTCKPFGKQIDPPIAKKLCVVVILFCLCSFWPIPVLYGKSTVVTPNQNTTGSSCYLDDTFKETSYLAYWNGLMLVMGLCTAICLGLLYFFIGKSIRNHVKAKNKLLIKEDKLQPSFRNKSPFRNKKASGIFGEKKSVDSNNEIKQVDLKVYTINNGNSISSNAENEADVRVDAEERRTAYTNEGVTSSAIDLIFASDLTEDTNKTAGESNVINEQEYQHLDRSAGRSMDTKHDEMAGNSAPGDEKHTNIKTSQEQAMNTGISVQNSRQKQINRENSRKHREALRNQKRSQRTTQMFFAITILYFVTFIPHLILQVITLTTENFVPSLSFAWQTIYHIAFYCSFLNSMVNCYVYGFFDTMFRDELKKIYTGLCCNQE